jgi:hypothetical protein
MFPVGGSLTTEQHPALTESPTEHNAESVTPFAARRKSVARLAGLAVAALFLAAGAFATLWILERSGHETTTGQVGDTQAELRQVHQDLPADLCALPLRRCQ